MCSSLLDAALLKGRSTEGWATLSSLHGDPSGRGGENGHQLVSHVIPDVENLSIVVCCPAMEATAAEYILSRQLEACDTGSALVAAELDNLHCDQQSGRCDLPSHISAQNPQHGTPQHCIPQEAGIREAMACSGAARYRRSYCPAFRFDLPSTDDIRGQKHAIEPVCGAEKTTLVCDSVNDGTQRHIRPCEAAQPQTCST